MTRVYPKTSLHLAAAALTAALLCLPNSASAQSSSRKSWTIKEILAEREPVNDNSRQRMCQGGLFKPCVCAKDVSNSVQYRPAVKECGGKAAIVLSGKYLDVFSVVVRDNQNKDRWPVEGINGCSEFERDTLGLNKCSAFKVQKTIGVSSRQGDAAVHCLGASGYSPLFKNVVRITAKLEDVPNSNTDPLERLCLVGADKPLN